MIEPIETVGRSRIQHGQGSARAYLMQLHRDDCSDIVENLEELARSEAYTKLCAKVPSWEAGRFVAAGYHLEAAIPEFYAEGGAACFMAKYLCETRKQERRPLLVREVLIAAEGQERAPAQKLPAGYSVRQARKDDAGNIASLYRQLIPGTPNSLHDSSFIRHCIQEGRVIYCAIKGEEVVAVACAEIEPETSAARLAGFAIQREHRRQGVTLYLLRQLEKHLLEKGIRALFTTARATSPGMNLTFARNGYRFGGTLTNQENIGGELESVNVWHKLLTDDPGLAWGYLELR